MWCRLCVTPCTEHKSLFDENGHFTDTYQIMKQYFDANLLTSNEQSHHLNVVCSRCWGHTIDFHNFQQFVFAAQESLEIIFEDTESSSSHCDLEERNNTSEIIIDVSDAEEVLPTERNVEENSCSDELMLIEEVLNHADANFLDNEIAEKHKESEVIILDPDYKDVDIQSVISQRVVLPTVAIHSYKNSTFKCLQNIGTEYSDGNELQAHKQSIEIYVGEQCLKENTTDSENEDSESELSGEEFITIPCSTTAKDILENRTIDETLSQPQDRKHISNDQAGESPNEQEQIWPMNGGMDDDTIINEWKSNFKCRLCRKNQVSFTLLRNHFREKHPLKKFYIECCLQKFYYRCKLADHIRKHTDPRPYKCEICKKCFRLKAKYTIHMKQHSQSSGELSHNQFNLKNNDKSEDFVDVTTVSDEQTHNQTAPVSNGYVLKSIEEDDAVIAQWLPRLMCEKCGDVYFFFTALRTHFRKQHPESQFAVECCKRKFKYRSFLKDHIKRHLNPKPFTCTICGRGFSQRANLITHLHEHSPKRTFKTQKNLKCSYCNQTRTSFKLFRKHYRYKHPTQVFHLLCCGKKLKTKKEIEFHISSH